MGYEIVLKRLISRRFSRILALIFADYHEMKGGFAH
jgi:hypothetical protein